MKATYKKILIFGLLVLIFGLAMFLRVFFVSNTVLSDPVKYSADDGVYHMRLVENELLGNHFPSRIYFDPFTYFPYGTYIHFGPLYDQLLAVIIWLICLGHPTLAAINKIAPFYPAVMGSLVVFLVYFFAKKIWSRPVAVFSAFLIAIMPPFLFRSLLGNTDHHVGEVFFSTLAVLFFVYLIVGRKEKDLREVIRDKKFWLFTILTGIALGMYFLVWTGALLFLFIIFCFVIAYYLIKYLLGQNEEWILLAGCVIFLIALLMIAPFFGHPNFLQGRIYSVQHFLCFSGGILTFLITGLAGYYLRKKNKKAYFLPLVLFLGSVILAVVLRFLIPAVWDTLIKIALEVNSGMVDNKFARQMIGEMSPLRIRGGFANFSALFYLSLVSLGIIFYKFVKERKPEHLLLIVWTSIILFVVGIVPAFGQNRNSYYLSVVISLLAGFIIVEGFKFGWLAMRKANEFTKGSYSRFYFYVSSAVLIFNMVFFSLYPFPFNIDNTFPSNVPDLMRSIVEAAQSPVIIGDDWYSTLIWLRYNTPDPGLDYYALYKAPPIDKKTGKVEPYQYPAQAYGILARCDVGHDITYYSHRMPVANPFQQGIGYINDDGSVVPGEGTFFLATDESKATGYLDQLRAKYVIASNSLSDPNNGFKMYLKWVNANMQEYTSNNISEAEPTKFDLAMSTRLYFLDGSMTLVSKIVKDNKVSLLIPALNHFRLLYESKSDNTVLWGQEYKTTKQVKVFEYVKGAKISGKATPGSEIIISTNVKTNQNREFIYQQVLKTENGNFEFIVPYATGKQEKSDVLAGDYTVKMGNSIRNIKVLESDVLQGKTIVIN